MLDGLERSAGVSRQKGSWPRRVLGGGIAKPAWSKPQASHRIVEYRLPDGKAAAASQSSAASRRFKYVPLRFDRRLAKQAIVQQERLVKAVMRGLIGASPGVRFLVRPRLDDGDSDDE